MKDRGGGRFNTDTKDPHRSRIEVNFRKLIGQSRLDGSFKHRCPVRDIKLDNRLLIGLCVNDLDLHDLTPIQFIGTIAECVDETTSDLRKHGTDRHGNQTS